MSARTAVAVAHPNIALAKYWGKREGRGNVPATPSLSVTLSGLSTTTRVTFDDSLSADSLSINDVNAAGTPLARASEILERLRCAANLRAFAHVESKNDFPTASGLASSASGFAALTLAACVAAGLDLSLDSLADYARMTSASSARSFYSGYVELVPEGDDVICRPLAGRDHLPLSVLVCVVTEDQKAVSSSEAMKRVAHESPYFQAWIAFAEKSFTEIRAALLAKDLPKLGDLTEKNALAMHATCTSIGVNYMLPQTHRVLEEVRALRKSGTFAYATMDAGPHVKVLAEDTTCDRVAKALADVPGVLRVIRSRAGEGAHLFAKGENA